MQNVTGPGGLESVAVGPNAYWESQAQAYYQEHGDFLGDARLTWGPEGVDEDQAGWLGRVDGLDVLEVGCGAAQGARWAARHGARAVGLDLSRGMLRVGQAIDRRAAGPPSRPAPLLIEADALPKLVQADAVHLPFARGSFDLAFTAFGALSFVPHLAPVFAEVARVLRPGGRWVYSTSHPLRWCFPDSPNPDDLQVIRPYVDPEPYVELAPGGAVTYTEYQHTMAEHVSALVQAGFSIERLEEPTWTPAGQPWGSWTQERAALIPGTLMVAATLT